MNRDIALYTSKDGVVQLDAIISVEYRVKSVITTKKKIS